MARAQLAELMARKRDQVDFVAPLRPTPDAGPRWVKFVASFRDSGHAGVDRLAGRIIGAVQDYTAQVLAQQQIREDQRILHSAMDAVGEAFALYDPQNRLVYFNDEYAAIFQAFMAPLAACVQALQALENAEARALEQAFERAQEQLAAAWREADRAGDDGQQASLKALQFAQDRQALANEIAAIARDQGLEPLEAPPTCFELAIDALDIGAIKPFWRAVLGYRDDPPQTTADLSDPAGIGPGVWFQQMDEPRPQRSRMHVDLWVPHDVVQQRIQDALDAGGQLLSDGKAPSFWVLADAEGNEICLCTWQARDDG